MSSYEPLTATICEAQRLENSKLPILPDGSDSLDLFSFHDPFGVRKAILPVLLNDRGNFPFVANEISAVENRMHADEKVLDRCRNRRIDDLAFISIDGGRADSGKGTNGGTFNLLSHDEN